MAAAPTWDDFVQEHLLQTNLFCGVCMLSQLGEIVYSSGQLTKLSQEEAKQFLLVFRTTSKEAEERLVQQGFTVNLQSPSRTKQFKVYSKTYCSVYCTSADNQMGLTVNKLPYGVLVCLYTYPMSAARAVKQVELFCDKLRL